MHPQDQGDAPSSQQPSTVTYPSAATPPPPPGTGMNHMEPPHGVTPSANKPTKRRLFMIAGAALVFVAALATYAFAYYLPNKPENVWRSALNNTSKGYHRLVEYTTSDELSKKYEKGSKVDGSYSIGSGEITTDGSFTIQSDGKNATFSGDLGLGISRLQISGIAKHVSSSEVPDMYVKVDGITGLGDLFGMPQLDNLNDQWIGIDHSLIDSFVPDQESKAAITEDDMMEVVNAMGKVSDKYVFTTEPENAAFSVRKYIGEEKQDGKTTLHYKISPNKSNLKRYLKELSAELDKTKVNEWAKKNYGKPLSELMPIQNAADDLQGSETFDAWVNKDTKILHKVRFTEAENPDKNYAELLFNYDGGPKMPFSFKVGADQDGEQTTVALDVTLDTDKHSFTLGMDIDTTADSQATTIAIDATIVPGDKAVTVEVPNDAISLAQAMQALGFGDYISSLENSIENSLEQNLKSL